MTADVTRTNYSANSILTSTALNADFNQILTRINDFPADKLTDATVTKDKLASGAMANLTVTSKSATYTVTTSDQVNLGDASGGAFTYTLPTAVGNEGLILSFKKTDSSTNAITIDGNGSETIDGVATSLLNNQYDTLKIISDGANWHIIDTNEVRMYSGKYDPLTGFGSTNTFIPYYTNATFANTLNTSPVTIANSSANGFSITVDHACELSITVFAQNTGTGESFGISKDGSNLSGSILSLAHTQKIVYGDEGGRGDSVSMTTLAYPSEVYRPQVSSTGNATSNASWYILIHAKGL